MRRSIKYIAGGSAVALAAALAIGLQRPGAQPEDEASAIAPSVPAATAVFVADAAPMPDPGPADVTAEETAARIDALVTRLAEREAELVEMTAALTDRDARLDAVTTTLARREAEIQDLRDEIAALRERTAFDVALATVKGESAPEPILAAVEVTEADPGDPPTLALTRIHFESGSSALTPGGQVHVAAAAVMLDGMSVVQVRLLGYADRVGRADRNRALADARARAVADFLVRSGVPAELVVATGMGEDDLPVATGDGVAEPLNRSVAIVAVSRPTS